MIKSRFARFLRKFVHDERGATAVEFGLVSTAFLMFVIGTYVVGVYFLTWNRLQQGVENAARFASVHSEATTNELEEMIEGDLLSIGGIADNLEITISDASSNGINFRQVTATYEMGWDLPFMPQSVDDMAITVSSRTPISN